MATDDQRTLGRLEGRLDALIESVEQDRAERHALEARLFGKDGSNGALTKVSARVASLERWRSFIAGAVAVVSAIVGWLAIALGGRP